MEAYGAAYTCRRCLRSSRMTLPDAPRSMRRSYAATIRSKPHTGKLQRAREGNARLGMNVELTATEPPHRVGSCLSIKLREWLASNAGHFRAKAGIHEARPID